MHSHPSLHTPVPSSSSKAWVDPAALPNRGDISTVRGNAPDYVKQLNYNTYFSYGVGESEDTFGSKAGKAVRFVDVNIIERHGRLEATTVAELMVSKHMLNGAGMIHGGCIAYLIDNTPLVVLGLVKGVNGVGVTQNMNVTFHSPAPIGTCLRIESTSVSLGGRVMTSKCEPHTRVGDRQANGKTDSPITQNFDDAPPVTTCGAASPD
ncbi:hypothetical protein D9757_010941 [Collybiopsis confluens]|uniref:Thioesterase domain-containing protein n=1 Tax=Collybiopsis confluens TaxID=2823264 RepID=A0A8H5LQY0_9AGAR|nr:hypothetical protein D9757_010941 [Collybiopsis confluens]